MGRHWSKQLSKRLVLKSGAELKTLRDAGRFITDHLTGVKRFEPVGRAVTLLLQAADTGEAADIEAATDQVERVLQLQRLM